MYRSLVWKSLRISLNVCSFSSLLPFTYVWRYRPLLPVSQTGYEYVFSSASISLLVDSVAVLFYFCPSPSGWIFRLKEARSVSWNTTWCSAITSFLKGSARIKLLQQQSSATYYNIDYTAWPIYSIFIYLTACRTSVRLVMTFAHIYVNAPFVVADFDINPQIIGEPPMFCRALTPCYAFKIIPARHVVKQVSRPNVQLRTTDLIQQAYWPTSFTPYIDVNIKSSMLYRSTNCVSLYKRTRNWL